MKNLNTKKIFRIFIVISCLIFSLWISFLISINFIIDPIIYWLASTEGARICIAFILSWLGVSTIFDMFYKIYTRRRKIARFNALNVPYPRTFKGRKWYNLNVIKLSYLKKLAALNKMGNLHKLFSISIHFNHLLYT